MKYFLVSKKYKVISLTDINYKDNFIYKNKILLIINKWHFII